MPQFPPKLAAGDRVRIIAPSQSLSIISEDIKQEAVKKLEALGLEVAYGKHVLEMDSYDSSSVESRLTDIHEAFADPGVRGIFAVIGGYNSNQLLPYLDWELIRANPKVFIGYSDTTALQNAFLAKADLVTYSGPAFSTFGQRKYFDYTLDQCKACLFSADSFEVPAAETWTDDAWYLDQDDRHPIQNEGRWLLQAGEAEGVVIGGNLSTLSLLQGTPYFPQVRQPLLFIEGDIGAHFPEIERRVESLLQALSINGLAGIIIGRFPRACAVSREELVAFFKRHTELKSIPIVANMDFGHTNPMMTFPIGGTARLSALEEQSIQLVFTRH